MNLYLLANAITCAGAFVGFLYGTVRFFRPRKAVYAQMITLAAGCMALGRLYQLIRLLTGGDIFSRFHLGLLGVIGSLMFFFSANFGVMDTITDDGAPENRRFRTLPAIAPALTALIYLWLFLLSDQPLVVKTAAFFVSLLVAGASYYNLKHLIFPDAYGIINVLRPYNLLALFFEFLCLAEAVAMSRENAAVTLLIGILMGAVLPAIVVSVDRGIKQWSV